VRLYRSPRHFELDGYFRIVTALQQQLGDLLFPRAQANRLLLHASFFLRGEIITDAAQGSFPQIPCWKRPSPSSRKGNDTNLAGSPEIHSIHAAKQAGFPQQFWFKAPRNLST
jgi:hypothetical protein